MTRKHELRAPRRAGGQCSGAYVARLLERWCWAKGKPGAAIPNRSRPPPTVPARPPTADTYPRARARRRPGRSPRASARRRAAFRPAAVRTCGSNQWNEEKGSGFPGSEVVAGPGGQAIGVGQPAGRRCGPRTTDIQRPHVQDLNCARTIYVQYSSTLQAATASGDRSSVRRGLRINLRYDTHRRMFFLALLVDDDDDDDERLEQAIQ